MKAVEAIDVFKATEEEFIEVLKEIDKEAFDKKSVAYEFFY